LFFKLNIRKIAFPSFFKKVLVMIPEVHKQLCSPEADIFEGFLETNLQKIQFDPNQRMSTYWEVKHKDLKGLAYVVKWLSSVKDLVLSPKLLCTRVVAQMGYYVLLTFKTLTGHRADFYKERRVRQTVNVLMLSAVKAEFHRLKIKEDSLIYSPQVKETTALVSSQKQDLASYNEMIESIVLKTLLESKKIDPNTNEGFKSVKELFSHFGYGHPFQQLFKGAMQRIRSEESIIEALNSQPTPLKEVIAPYLK
jgi:hypothetical protein